MTRTHQGDRLRRFLPGALDSLALLRLARRVGVRRMGKFALFAATAYFDRRARVSGGRLFGHERMRRLGRGPRSA